MSNSSTKQKRLKACTALSSIVELTPEESAEYANLAYVTPDNAGISRRRFGQGFAYYSPAGNKITDNNTIQRIHSLAIPPAYNDVWICPNPNGHLQATGISENGKTQYIYHPRWRQYRDIIKFNEMIIFGQLLPDIRRYTEKQLKESNTLNHERVLSAVVRMLDMTHVRIGNEEYADENESYGATTLRKKHIDTDALAKGIKLEFEGKSGKRWDLNIEDPLLVEVILQCTDAPGYELFKYYDEDGNKYDVSSDDVNEFLQRITEHSITAKFFRTWAGTVTAVKELGRFQTSPPDDENEAREHINQAIEAVSKELRNTPSVCRKCYIHPMIIEAYLNQSFDAEINADINQYFSKSEAATLSLLKRNAFTAE